VFEKVEDTLERYMHYEPGKQPKLPKAFDDVFLSTLGPKHAFGLLPCHTPAVSSSGDSAASNHSSLALSYTLVCSSPAIMAFLPMSEISKFDEKTLKDTRALLQQQELLADELALKAAETKSRCEPPHTLSICLYIFLNWIPDCVFSVSIKLLSLRAEQPAQPSLPTRTSSAMQLQGQRTLSVFSHTSPLLLQLFAIPSSAEGFLLLRARPDRGKVQ
jgi:hypothetical protein